VGVLVWMGKTTFEGTWRVPGSSYTGKVYVGVSIGHGDRQPRQVSTYILVDMVWWLGRHGRIELRNLALRNRRWRKMLWKGVNFWASIALH
jgi:hypothetical protein